VIETHKRALQYIENTGGNPPIGWFDDDNAPIGPDLRRDMKEAGLIAEVDGRIEITNKGND